MLTESALKKRIDTLAAAMGTEENYYIQVVEMWGGKYRLDPPEGDGWGMGVLFFLMKKAKGGGDVFVRELNPREVLELGPKIALNGAVFGAMEAARQALVADPDLSHMQGNVSLMPGELAHDANPGVRGAGP